MRLPKASPTLPLLPWELVRKVAQDVVGEDVIEDSEQDRRDDARSLSLVCRELRYIGQEALFHRVTLPHRELETALATRSAANVLKRVRRTRWLYRGQDEQHDASSSASVFINAIRRMPALRAVELYYFPPRHLSDIFHPLSFTKVDSLTIIGDRPDQSYAFKYIDEPHLILLLGFPRHLASLNLDLSTLGPDLRHPGLEPARYDLHLRELGLGVAGKGLPANYVLPGVPYHRFLQAVRRSTLESLGLGRSSGHDGWLRWLGQPDFTSLQAINIMTFTADLDNFLSLLIEILSFHPTLDSFAIEVSREVQIDDLPSSTILLPFLSSLPLSLRHIDLPFPFPREVYPYP
ncbi:hypothetical protein JCM11641_001946 [Rhodosporidiobolus odoratus]